MKKLFYSEFKDQLLFQDALNAVIVKRFCPVNELPTISLLIDVSCNYSNTEVSYIQHIEDSNGQSTYGVYDHDDKEIGVYLVNNGQPEMVSYHGEICDLEL